MTSARRHDSARDHGIPLGNIRATWPVRALLHNRGVAVDLRRRPVITTGIIAVLTGGSAFAGHAVGFHVLRHNMVAALTLAVLGTLCAAGLLFALTDPLDNLPLWWAGVALAWVATGGAVFVAGMDELAGAPRTDVVVADVGCADLEGSGRAERCVRNWYELVDRRGRPVDVDLVTPHTYELDTALSLYHLPSGQLVEYPYLAAWVHDHLRLPLVAARWVFAGYLLLVCTLVVRVRARRNRSQPRTDR